MENTLRGNFAVKNAGLVRPGMNPGPYICIILFSIVFSISACGGQGEPSSGEKLDDPYLKCASPLNDRQKEAFKLSPLEVERVGYDVSIRGINRGLVVIGLLAGITEATDANLKNIDLFLEHFKDAGAQAIVVVGGVGLMSEDVDKILSRLARAPVPILITPGDQENFDVLRRVISRLRKKSPQILDMTLIRRVRIGNLTLVSIPGYFRPFYLKADKRGCSYDEDDLLETMALFQEDRTNVLVSPTPPRGTGEKSVDRSRNGVNIGDPALAKTLADGGIKFGLFGYAYEAGGHATLDNGRTGAAQGIWQESLFIQAGAAEALPMTLVGEGRAVGMAQIVEFSGDRARYRTIYSVR